MAQARLPLVAGNWKMNGLGPALAEVSGVAAGLARGEAGRAEVALCLPATLISRAAGVAGPSLLLGGQDCAVRDSGAHTGDVSAPMLRDAGARLVIVGHSERRADHGETDATVRAKAEAAARAGLTAVLCVGETRAERDAGREREVVGAQLDGSVPPGATADGLVIAYEPVWAIGTGLVPTEADVAAVHAFIRDRLGALLPGEAGAVRILYGGSVKPDNARALLAVPDVDGALVGGASLKSADFLAIAGAYR